MKHVSIAGKVIAIVAVLALAVIGATGFATVMMRAISAEYRHASGHEGVASVLLARSSREMVGMRASIADLVISTTDDGNRAATSALATQRADFVKSMDGTIALLPDQAARLSSLEHEALDAIDQTCAHAVDLGSKATAADAVLQSQAVYGHECAPAVTHAVADFRQAVDELLDQTRAVDAAAETSASNTIRTTWLLTLGGCCSS